MMAHLLCNMLLLVLLTGRAVVLVKASNDSIRCGNDNCCQAMGKLMTGFNEINNKEEVLIEKIDKQAKDLEQMKGKLDRRLASMSALSKQLERLSADFLRHDERLKANDVNEKLDKIATDVSHIHSKQVKDVEELKVNMNRSISSTSAISTQLEKHSADLLRHDDRLKAHDVSQNNNYELVKKIHGSIFGPKDCSDIKALGHSTSGVYRVYPGSVAKRIQADVYCDMTTPGGNWLVFQRRIDGSVNFERTWIEYQNGFGNPSGEFWLGNEALYQLTSNGKYKLRIDMEDFGGQKRYAEYATFSIGSSADRYRLAVSGYTGNTGDSLAAYHNGMKFSTKDADNDLHEGSCAQLYRGAWWYNKCHHSNLNGLYLRDPNKSSGDGIEWRDFYLRFYSLKITEMKIAAVN